MSFIVVGKINGIEVNVFKDERVFAHYSSALRACYREQLRIKEYLYIKKVNAPITDTDRLNFMIGNQAMVSTALNCFYCEVRAGSTIRSYSGNDAREAIDSAIKEYKK